MKTESSIDSIREIVQDFLVPEPKAIKVEVASLRSEMNTSFDLIRTEMRRRDEKQVQATKSIDDKLTQSVQHLSDNLRQLSDKIDRASRTLGCPRSEKCARLTLFQCSPCAASTSLIARCASSPCSAKTPAPAHSASARLCQSTRHSPPDAPLDPPADSTHSPMSSRERHPRYSRS